MRNAARQGPQRLHFLRLAQLLLNRPKLRLFLLECRDVGYRHKKTLHLSIDRIRQKLHIGLNALAIEPQQGDLELLRIAK